MEKGNAKLLKVIEFLKNSAEVVFFINIFVGVLVVLVGGLVCAKLPHLQQLVLEIYKWTFFIAFGAGLIDVCIGEVLHLIKKRKAVGGISQNEE